MFVWVRDLSLKYKFWALNMVAFVISLLLVLYAVHVEQQSRSADAQRSAQSTAELLAAWPATAQLPARPEVVRFAAGERMQIQGQTLAQNAGWTALAHDRLFARDPLIGAQSVTRADGQALAVLARTPSVFQVLGEHFFSYAGAVAVLMLGLLGASQLLISFLLSHLNTLKDVMLHVERSGDLSARVPLESGDEVGQMASAFNAMQGGYQRIVGTVAQAAARLDDGAGRLAASMSDVRQGMLGQQSETDQAATAINEMSTTVFHIAEHASDTRDRSQHADQLASDGQRVVARVEQSIANLSVGVQQTAETIGQLAADSQKINGVVSVIHSIAEQTKRSSPCSRSSKLSPAKSSSTTACRSAPSTVSTARSQPGSTRRPSASRGSGCSCCICSQSATPLPGSSAACCRVSSEAIRPLSRCNSPCACCWACPTSRTW